MIMKYWQIHIWWNQLAIYNSYIPEIWANAHETRESL